MSIPLNCPNCGQAYNLADRFAGLAVRCKRCGGAIEVPTLPNLHVRYEAVPLPEAPLDPSWAAGPPAAPPRPLLAPKRPRRRKSNVALFIGLSIGAAGLFVLVAAAMIALLVMHKAPQMAGMQPGAGWPPRQPANAPFAGGGARAPAVVHPTPDELAKDLLAAYNDVGNAMASVVDAKSANAQAATIASSLKRLIQVASRLDGIEISAEDDRRLHAQYDGQLNAAKTRIEGEIARIKRNPEAAAEMGRRLHWEDLKQGITHLMIRSKRKARLRGPMQSINRGLSSDALPNPFANMSAAQVVSVVVNDLPGDVRGYITQRLSKLSGATSSRTVGTSHEMTVSLGPVSDVRTLAARIDFGEVTKIDDARRTIFVRADAARLPKPEATDPLAPDFYRQNLADLRSEDPNRRRAAVTHLRWVSQPKELRNEIGDAMLNLLTGPDVNLRADVIRVLPIWSSADKAVPKLLDLLGDTNHGVVELAIEALGQFKDVRAIEPIVQRAKHHGSAITAIRQFGAAAEPVLLQHLDGADREMQRFAVNMLGQVGTEKSLPALESLLKSTDALIKHDTETSIKEIQKRHSRARPSSP